MDVKSTLGKIGKSVFVNFYYDFKDNSKTNEELTEILYKNNSNSNSRNQNFRIKRARKLFSERKNLEALDIICHSNGVADEIKEKALQILHDEQEKISRENDVKVTYLSEIIESLKELDGTATLSEIYETIQKRNLLPYINTNSNWKDNVRATIQRHCKETKSYLEGNENLFYAVNNLGSGIWGLVGYNSDTNTSQFFDEIQQNIILSKNYDLYTKENFLSDVFMSEKEYDKLTALLKRKKNIILQGAPGVGKTFCSKRLAWSVMGEKNNDRVCMVQFHQSYSYEDFIMGYRPTDNGGFELENGVFYRFCETAKNDADNEYFFIIDEINRGNLSKIFGELLMLIENDKRGSEHQINLVYGNEPFYIPENLYIIGMMNTADRSLAMIDYALRRRFSFYTMPPAFEKADENGFAEYIQKIECPLYHSIIAKIIELNKAIKEDTSLGKGFEIGHSYFISDNINDEWVKSDVEYEIIPLIEEYWFDNDSELSKWKEKLYLAIGEPYDE